METDALNVYLTQTVGQQWLGRTERDVVRRNVPATPFSFAELRAWFGMGNSLARQSA